MQFDYSLLPSPGWAEARVRSGSAFAHLRASCLSDALGDLLRASLDIRRGATTARCSWEEEPGEWRWLFTTAADRLEVRILGFNDIYDHEPDSAGREVFAADEPADDVIKAMVRAARQLLSEIGEDEYHRRWIEHPFPTTTLGA